MKTLNGRKPQYIQLGIFLGLIAILALALLPGVFAADQTAGNEAELVTAINTVNAAGLGDHSITLTADITLTAPLPALNNPDATGILLDGAGFTLDAAGTGTALAITRVTIATIRDITITGGAGSSGLDGKSGGGIFNLGDLTVIDATITGNTATFGAGIMNAGGEDGGSAALQLTGVTISGNQASNAGGGLGNYGNTSTASATVTNSVISGNSASQYGGGIANNGVSGAADLTVTNSTIHSNQSSYGGGLFNNGNSGQATATFIRSTLSGNTVTESGGALFNNGNLGTATLSLTNSTVSGNTSNKSGGGIATTSNNGTALVSLHFATIAANTAVTGSGLYVSNASVVETTASIIAAGSQGKACAFAGGTSLTSNGYNLDSDGFCGLAGTGDISGGNPALEPLATNAPGTTATHALAGDSDAQRRIPDGTAGCGGPIATDQRGATRPNPAPSCDIGAYESDATGDGPTATPTTTGTPPTPTATPTGTPPSPTPTATTTATATATATPTATATIPPINCVPPYNPAGETALNQAIICVNAAGAGTHLITLAGNISLTGPTVPLNNPTATELVVDGNGYTIDGKRKGTVLSVAAGTTARIRDITLTGGQGSGGPTGNWGGGIFNSGDLTLENSTLRSNIALRGGGIANHGNGGAAELTIVRSTLSGNVATAHAGGILNMGSAGGSATLRVENATLTGNYAAAGGGGLYNQADNGNATATVAYSTLALNTATSGGGGIHTLSTGGGSTVSLSATIITNGSGAGPDCATPGGSIISTGYNLAGDGTCNLTQASDQAAANAALQPQDVNPPGTTATHALGEGSAAIDRIPAGSAGCGTTFPTDQRGAPRPYPAAGKCDVGAFERQSSDEVPPGKVYIPVVRR